MSTQSPFGSRASRVLPTLPKGDAVASYETYAEAQSAVDSLAKAEFPVKELAIVGTDLTSVERITGTLSWGRAAGGGALSGAWFGTFLGLLLFIFSPAGTSLGVLAAAVLFGAAFGMIFGVVTYSINRRRRDFTSTMQVLATRYAIIAASAHVERARTVLGVDGAQPAIPVAATPAAGTRPMSYGEATDAARRAAAAGASPSRPERPRYGELAPTPEELASEAEAAKAAEAAEAAAAAAKASNTAASAGAPADAPDVEAPRNTER